MFLVHLVLVALLGIPGWILEIAGECLTAVGNILTNHCNKAIAETEKGAEEARKKYA